LVSKRIEGGVDQSQINRDVRKLTGRRFKDLFHRQWLKNYAKKHLLFGKLELYRRCVKPIDKAIG